MVNHRIGRLPDKPTMQPGHFFHMEKISHLYFIHIRHHSALRRSAVKKNHNNRTKALLAASKQSDTDLCFAPVVLLTTSASNWKRGDGTYLLLNLMIPGLMLNRLKL